MPPTHTSTRMALSEPPSLKSTQLHRNRTQLMLAPHNQLPSLHLLRTTAALPPMSTTSKGAPPTTTTTAMPTAAAVAAAMAAATTHARAIPQVPAEAVTAPRVVQTRPHRLTQTPTGAGRTISSATTPGRASHLAYTQRAPRLSSNKTRETRAGGADSCIGSPPNRSPRGSPTRGGSSDAKELAN